jgi:hypothetical protein
MMRKESRTLARIGRVSGVAQIVCEAYDHVE